MQAHESLHGLMRQRLAQIPRMYLNLETVFICIIHKSRHRSLRSRIHTLVI